SESVLHDVRVHCTNLDVDDEVHCCSGGSPLAQIYRPYVVRIQLHVDVSRRVQPSRDTQPRQAASSTPPPFLFPRQRLKSWVPPQPLPKWICSEPVNRQRAGAG